MKIYVSATTVRSGSGTRQRPFMTIVEAAKVARAGDEVIVAPGIYREWVDPRNAGTEENRIVYRSEEMGKAVISGAEPVKNWENYKGDVWVARIGNGLFGDYNPYTTVVSGDWYFAPDPVHMGEVYLNGRAMYEVLRLEDVQKAEVFSLSWEGDFSRHKWYTEQDEGDTLIYANFLGLNPNEENVEINVRKNCFLPSKEGISYITLSGFTIKQAATQWAHPTAYQGGMVGPHWSKGWIIEDCEISDSRCSGISLEV